MRCAVLLAILVSCAHPRAFTPDDRTSIEAVIESQRAAWNRGDLAGYMDGYARIDNLIFTSGGHVRRGWQTAFDLYKSRYGTDAASMGKVEFAITSIDALGADAAVVLGTWKLDGPNAGHGVFTLVFERRPAGWRIVHDHTSLEAP
jgi:beta-aspartyl-peptidase (threonine type)